MRKTYAYIISILTLFALHFSDTKGQDTIIVPLKISVGIEASGPVIYVSDKNIFNTEAYVSVDLNEKYSAALNAGYLDYKYSQYNYEYLTKGAFARAGIDINLLKPKKSKGIYWGGLGIRYGVSIYSSEVPSYQKENYWGLITSSIPRETNTGHFIEFSPGVRAEVFKNFSMGWTISLRKMLSSGSSRDLQPIYMPGFGNGGKTVSTGISYFLVWNIPYKKKQVIIPKEEPEDEDIIEPVPNQNNQNNDFNQQYPNMQQNQRSGRPQFNDR